MSVFAMPDVGEGLTEAEILTWHVAPGDTVTVNQVIVEIETAKAAVELPSPYAGTVAELLAAPGDTVAVGTPIITISDGSEKPSTAGSAAAAGRTTEGSTTEGGSTAAGSTAAGGSGGAKIGEVTADGRIATLVGYVAASGAVTRRRRKALPAGAAGSRAAGDACSAERSPSAERHESRSAERDPGAVGSGYAAQSGASPDQATVPLAKPPVRKLARELGIDLHALTGSGPSGVITRDDVRERARPAPALNGTTPAGVRREPIRSVRKATAAAMVRSAFTAPHVTEFLTVDVTSMIELRDRLRATLEYAEIKLSPLTFVAKAVCLAVRRTPEVNAHWDEGAQEIVYYDRVQLGIAAATPRGLIVPKIPDADRLGLRELATALTALTATARAGTTEPAALRNGTFTITNVGVFGVDTGTPILNPGESAILALGAVKQAPWVVDGQLAVRTVCHLALSFDHRVVDGEQGSRFLAEVGALLADPGLAFTY
ncbi:MAG: 2-oxo acid dehydrogenase subunit E2 [Actinomycetota bacterium]|nr:2-oxo acid dehydrogenase subunit E2 [Actinomycetota bacterium]